jgi:hypothetical protein
MVLPRLGPALDAYNDLVGDGGIFGRRHGGD